MKRAFTLIEVLIVISFIGIIGSVLIIRSLNVIENTKITATRKELNQIKKAIIGDPDTGNKGFYGDLGTLPNTLDELFNQGTYPSWNKFTERGWNGPYVQQGYDTDAWGENYVYNKSAGTIRSKGPDKILGTSDDIIIDIWR